MRILIVADLHANLEAVRSLPENCDELWVLGDLVDYGPDPCAVVEFVRRNASLIIRGNHDHAVGYDRDPRCSPRFERMAEETRRYTRSVLTGEQLEFLRGLPLRAERLAGGARFALCHATPGDPLYEYRLPDSPLWDLEPAVGGADVLLVGHTHLPFQQPLGRRILANPGSAGQPKHGHARACYAIWEDGRLRLKSAEYPVEETVAKLRALPIAPDARADLIGVLRAGSAAALS
jgi:putative phosphoesterase